MSTPIGDHRSHSKGSKKLQMTSAIKFMLEDKLSSSKFSHREAGAVKANCPQCVVRTATKITDPSYFLSSADDEKM